MSGDASLSSSRTTTLRQATHELSPAAPIENQQPMPRPLSAVQVELPFVEPTTKNSSFAHHLAHQWRFGFDDFVVGPCNELAHAASRCMCGTAAPDILYLNSAPGLGKTHLMHAVGKLLCSDCNSITPRVEYLTAEEFASRFYLSLRTQETDKFKARYRDIDLLLLEDVHFLQGKEKMQSELLCTVKALAEKGAKVVFTSSFAASELQNMDEQLQSRLASGLLAPITKPDEETRKRIFRQKAKIFQVNLSEDVEDVLGKYIRSDVRQIESCLRNLILKAQLLQSPITMEMAWETIGNYVNHTPVLDIDGIIRFVCQGFGASVDDLSSKSRKQEYVTARNTAFFLARKHTDLSLESIGKMFNRRHSTVLKGITNLEREMKYQTPVGRQISQILSMVEKNGAFSVPHVSS